VQNRTRPDVGDVVAFQAIRDEPIDAVRARLAQSKLLLQLDDHQTRNVAIMTSPAPRHVPLR